MKACWLSRHPMTAEQLADLEKTVGEKLEVTTMNVTWASTANCMADFAENLRTADDLAGRFDVISGVFPPVAFKAFVRRGYVTLYSPVSEQSAAVRADGAKQIAFKHLRWETISL